MSFNDNLIPDVSYSLPGNDDTKKEDSFSLDDIAQSVSQAGGQDIKVDGEKYSPDDDNVSTNDGNTSYNINDTDFEVLDDNVDGGDTNQLPNTQQPKEDDKPVEKGYGEDVYSALFDLIKERQIFYMPEDVEGLTPEGLEEMISKDQQVRNQQALAYVRNQSDDPRLQELFDHVQRGGSWEDVQTFKEIQQDEDAISSYDVAKENDQRELIELYLRDGLDPNNPSHQRRLNNIYNDVDTYIERKEGQEMAAEAKGYFQDKVSQYKESEAIRVQQEQEKQQAAQYEEFERKKNWTNEFHEVLNEREWSQDKKKNVVDQFQVVELDNGQQMELWKYKWNKIWEYPELTHMFMDFVSDLDPYSLEFGARAVPTNKKASNMIQNMINAKQDVSKRNRTSVSRLNQNKSTNSNKKINPLSDW